MTDADHETRWRKEFEEAGYDAVHRGHMTLPEPRRQLAFRWLREKERLRESRDEEAHWYLKWTFRAAVAAVVVGIIGVSVTWYWH